MRTNIQLIALAALVALTFSSCQNDEDSMSSPQSSQKGTPDFSENGANPDEDFMSGAQARNSQSGYIYTESNATALNEILCYKQHGNGSLTLVSTVASGGIGSGTNLGSQGALAISNNHQWLFACNAGDNTISSFSIAKNGSLTLMQTIGSGGIKPVSLALYQDRLYVANQTSANISGFSIGAEGTITVIGGSNRQLSASTADPGQISFSLNGNYLYVTERGTNVIATYPVSVTGSAGAGSFLASAGVTPFGFDYARGDYMIVANAAGDIPNLSSVSSYSGVNTANLSAVNGAVPNNQAAACWMVTTKHGRFAFTTNFVSNTISSYYVAPWGSVYLAHQAAAPASAPRDIIIASNNYYVYSINTGDNTIGGYTRAVLGDLNVLNSTTGLPDHAAGLVAW
ncbi:lactonase family protein [Flavobacterium sp. GT2N3]|uniref:lactonase family protein n=1 Tax=unclassified Flavobacterium TaxID=196869 RepID=UPI003AAE8636